jgi:predicted heme/steroid binding protein
MKTKVRIGLGLVLTTLISISIAGCKQSGSGSAKNGNNVKTIKLQKKTYTASNGTNYQISLNSDGTFTDKSIVDSGRTIQVRSGKYKFNKSKTTASFKVNQVASAEFPNATALKANKAPLAVTRQDVVSKMSANQRNVDSLKATKSGFKLGKVSLRKKGQSLPTLISFYQNQQVNYTDSYAKLYGVVFDSGKESSNQYGYGEIVFKDNHFLWNATLFKAEGSDAYAEGTFVYDVSKSQLQLHIDHKSPLYQGSSDSTDYTSIKYNSLGTSPFVKNDVIMQVKTVGNEVKLSTTTPDLNVYSNWSHDASLYGELTKLTVAGIENGAIKNKTIKDIFPNAGSFERYVEDSFENTDGISNFTVSTDETISVTNDNGSEEIKTLYAVDYVYDNGDPDYGGKEERISIAEDGTVYWGYPEGESTIDNDKTAEIQAKLN